MRRRDGAAERPDRLPGLRRAGRPRGGGVRRLRRVAGPLDPAGTGDPAAAGPTDVTLGAVWRATWSGRKSHYGTLMAAVFTAGILWCTISVTLIAGTVFLFEILEQTRVIGGGEWPYFAGALLCAAAVTAVACCFVHGLAGMHLGAARGGTSFRHLFRPPRIGRAILCGTPLAFSVAVLLVAPGFFAYWAGLGGIAAAVGMFAAWLLVPLAAFTLFWPTSFLIHERPALRHVRPLIAAAAPPREVWGGRIAVALAAYPLMVLGPMGLLSLLTGASGLGMFGAFGLMGTLLLGACSLPSPARWAG